MALALRDKNNPFSPYVHSNYYLFANQLRGDMQVPQDETWKNKMSERIKALEKVRDRLREEAQDFLGGDDPKEAFRHLMQTDSELSQMGRDVVADPGARKALLKATLSKKEIKEDVFDEEFYDKFSDALLDEIDIKDLVEQVSVALFGEGGTLAGKSGREQREALKRMFKLNEKEADRILNEGLKKQLKSSSGKIQKIVKDLIIAARKEHGEQSIDTNEVYLSFIKYFKTAMKQKAKERGLYSIGDQKSAVDRYIDAVEKKLASVIKQRYSSTNASGSLGEEIISEVNNAGNGIIIMIPVGSKSEMDIRSDKRLMNATNAALEDISKAATWNDPTKMSYTDLILVREVNGAEKRVRAQSKNYVDAYETFLDTEDVYQHTHLFSKQMLFKDFFEKLLIESGGRANIAGGIDLAELSYIVANEWWFDEKGSSNAGGHQKGWRENKTNTRIFGSDSFLSRALSGAFVNFLGIVVDESGEVIPNLSNVFFLINNKALVPTYELIDNVISYYKNGTKEMTNIEVTVARTGVKPEWISPELYLKAKADATDNGLSAATYEEEGLVRVGRTQGQHIMDTLRVNSVNLGIDLKKMLTSAWKFDVPI